MRNKNNIRSSPDAQNIYEICVSCGNETDIKISTPIDKRLGYIEGCGQMCKSCYEIATIKNSYGFIPEQISYLRKISAINNK